MFIVSRIIFLQVTNGWAEHNEPQNPAFKNYEQKQIICTLQETNQWNGIKNYIGVIYDTRHEVPEIFTEFSVHQEPLI